MRRTTWTCLAAACLTPAALAGGVPNDTCATAIPVPCNSSVTFDNTLADPGWDGPLPFCAFGELQTNSLWYSFVALTTTATLRTCDSVGRDTTMSLYAGSCGDLVEIGCSEDECGSNGFLGEVTVEGLEPGATYYVQVGSWDPGTLGVYTLEISCEAQLDCVICPIAGVSEGEAVCTDNWSDTFNAGCDAPPPVNAPTIPVGTTICGTTGEFTVSLPDGTVFDARDNDWFRVAVPQEEGATLTWTVLGEFTPELRIAAECGTLLGSIIGEPCEETELVAFVPAGEYLVSVAPLLQGGVAACGVPYVATATLTDPPFAACCLGDGTCVDTVTSFDCAETLGGTWGGVDSRCIDLDCCDLVVCCDPACADLTADGFVDLDDLNAVLFALGGGDVAAGDATCDGIVDLDDLNLVLGQWQDPCP